MDPHPYLLYYTFEYHCSITSYHVHVRRYWLRAQENLIVSNQRCIDREADITKLERVLLGTATSVSKEQKTIT
jgi:hypothetical protein